MFPNNNNEKYPQFPCARHYGQFTHRFGISSFCHRHYCQSLQLHYVETLPPEGHFNQILT